MKANSNNKNIHSLSGVTREKVKNLQKKMKNLPLNMCSTLQSDNYNIYWSVLWTIVRSLTPIGTSK
jgi:hypothetical protein